MPLATRHYRLRIRNAADDADALILSSVPGGTNPYLTGRPRGDGQEIDPATGESSIGAYTIEVADVSEIVTAALVDGSGRQALIQRRAYIELSTDVGSSWPIVLIPGFINGYRLVTAMRWAFTVGESRRVEYTRMVWDRVTEKFNQATCLIGGPVKGEWGPTVDYGGWCFRVTASDADTVTLRPNLADLPIDEDTEHVQLTGSTDDDILIALGSFVRNRANRFAAADQALVETTTDEDTYPGIVVLVQELDGTEVDYFTPRVQVHEHKDVLLTPKDEIKLPRAGTAWSVTPPDVDTIFRLYVWRTTVDEDTPLHIDAHPVDILTDLWDEAGIAYDSTEATTVRGLIGENTRLMLRIDESWKLGDVQKMIGGLFGINTRVGTDGELEVITTRIRSIAEPASLYDDDDLRSADTVIFDVDEESIYNTVTVEEQRFVPWKSGMGDQPIDKVVARSHIRSRDLNSEGGATPDSESFGLRELRFTVPGTVKIDVSGPGLGDDEFVHALAIEVFDRFGRGGVYATVAALPTITEKVGEELRLDVSHLPNAGARGGQRILQVVRRTETPSGPELLLLDSGPNSQFGTAPTFTIAAGAADARRFVDITVTNAAALNAAGASLRVQWAAASSEPSSGSVLTEYGTGMIPSTSTTYRVDAGSHIWIRMQAFIPEGRPTAYTAWQDVDLTDLTAPSSLSRSVGDDPALNTITFTQGETDIPLEVLQRPQGDPADEARVVDNLKEGSDRVTLTLIPGNSYTIGIRYRERGVFAGVSSTTEISFTVAGSPDTLPAPTQPFALGAKWATGSLDGSSGVEPGDWPGDVTDQYAVGLRVRSAIDEGFIEFDMATETAVESGTPGSYSTEETRSVAGVDETYVFMIDVPLDGKLRYLRARHVRVGATASPYTSVVSILPGEILSPAPPVDPLDITGIVPVTLGGTGVADPSSGVLLLGAAADPTTELAPGAAGGYARSNGSAWTRSGLLAADLTGTVASARLSGVYAGITGLGEQAQALDMGGNNITTVGALTATTGVFSSTLGVSGLITATGGVSVLGGSLTMGNNTTGRNININGAAAAAGARDVRFQTAGVNRWLIRTDTGAESGSDAGSPFEIIARNDAGGSLGAALTITRASRAVAFNGAVTINNSLSVVGSTYRIELNDGEGASRKSLLIESLGYDSNAYARIESYDYGASTAGALYINALGGLVTFGGDVTIGDLGVFDSTDTPTDRQLLLYNDGISKWQAEDVQLAWGNSDVKAAVLTDNTAVTYILEDPGAGADSPVGAPSVPSAPTLYGAHESITLEVVGYSRPADFRYFEWRYSEDNFVADDHALATTTSDKIVHARLDNTTTYYYKVRATDRAANSSSYSSVSNTTPVANGSQAFGVILAAEIGCANLAAIQANIGIITAGQMRDSTNVYGMNLGGAGGIPVGWAAGINFENTAVDGMDRYVNFYEGASDGLDFFIKHEHFDLMHDGTARFRGFLDLTAFGEPWGLSSQWGVFRAPDLAHGMTDVVPTDVALDLLLQSTTQGGVTVRGLTGTGSDTVTPLLLFGISGRPSPVTPSVHIYGRKKNGTTTQALADDEPILRVSSIALTSDIAFAVFPKRADFPAEMSCTGEQTFSSTGTQNNVSLDDSVSVFNYTGGSATTITGFSGGYQGRLVYVVNAGVALTIAENSGSSSLGNRVYTGAGANVVFSTRGGFFMRYDGTYWRILALSN